MTTPQPLTAADAIAPQPCPARAIGEAECPPHPQD